jgi:uncharacterized protein (DUF1919 family)
MYHKFGLNFTSPTVWSFFYPQDYMRFLENLEWYLKQTMHFTKKSKHPTASKLKELVHRDYPIGVLGGDVEIHFLHYLTEAEAQEKWNRRAKRVNFDNLFVVFSDAEEGFSEQLLKRYENLPFENKVFFSSKPRPNCKSAVFIEEYAQRQGVLDSTRNRKYEKYFDLVKWLNGEENYRKNERNRGS